MIHLFYFLFFEVFLFAYFNGRFFSETKGIIPITDRGFLFGDGVFSTLLIEDGVPLFLEEQLQKLYHQCSVVNILPPDISKELIISVIEKNKAYDKPYSMKIIISGGSSTKKRLHLRKGTLAIFLQTFQIDSIDLKVNIFPFPFHLCHSWYKSLANLNRLYVLDYAKSNDYDDAITHTYNDILLETSFGNIFWIINENVFTPNPNTLPLYFGITINKITNILKKFSYDIHFVEQNYHSFPKEALLFRTSSLTGIKPIRKLNDIVLKKSDSITLFLQNLYKKLIEDYKTNYFNSTIPAPF